MLFYTGLALDLRGGKSTVKAQVFLPAFLDQGICVVRGDLTAFSGKKTLIFLVVFIKKFWVFFILPKTQ